MPPKTVLFVDDDSEESYLFNEALEHSGLDIKLIKAGNGNTMLSLLQTEPLPDMVIMDINMPYKDGIETLTEIRSNPKFNKLPVVIYSTARNEGRISLGYDKGANLFVIKPNDFTGLVNVVKKVFSLDWSDCRRPSREEFVVSVE